MTGAGSGTRESPGGCPPGRGGNGPPGRGGSRPHRRRAGPPRRRRIGRCKRGRRRGSRRPDLRLGVIWAIGASLRAGGKAVSSAARIRGARWRGPRACGPSPHPSRTPGPRERGARDARFKAEWFLQLRGSIEGSDGEVLAGTLPLPRGSGSAGERGRG